jgi:hypothetical protein
VDIVDFLPDITDGPQVPVISASALPKAVRTSSIRLAVFHMLEKSRALTAYPQKGTLGNRSFDGEENLADGDSRSRQQD